MAWRPASSSRERPRDRLLRQRAKELDEARRGQRVAQGETKAVGAEAHALAIRMGLYRQVLKSDVQGVLATAF